MCCLLTFAVQSGSTSRVHGAGLRWYRRWAVDSRLRLRGRTVQVRE